MISPKKFYGELIGNGIDFFTGVPDSLLKDFCAYITDNAKAEDNIITANEGNAIALAAGHYLATGKPGMVYMQNSGLGNAVNPLASLADPDVYSIPMLLLIGWRGEPGKKDEPQHVKMGKITLRMLDTLEIPYRILDDNYAQLIKDTKKYMESRKAPCALVARAGTFEEYGLKNTIKTDYELSREDALKLIIPTLSDDDIIVSTTGKGSRELFELRESKKQGHARDFLTVGSMGHSSSIALGIALEKPGINVYILDGDGALIMHMGALSVISQLRPKNLKHIVFNNFAHDSVGGQPTSASNINIPEIAMANGYKVAFSASTKEEVVDYLKKMKKSEGPVLLEIKINKGARKDLGRPTTSPIQNKEDFMGFLGKK